MKCKRLTVISLFSVVALFCTVAASAAPWMTFGPKRQLHTLIITGNYKSPRLLADMIQNQSRQPYILLPDPARNDNKIYFCPPKSHAIEVKEGYFNDFIRTAGPKRIVILGDERYVPRRFEDMLDKAIPVVRITGASWPRIAEELNFMLNLNNLGRDYRRLRDTMLEEGGIYRPVSRPAPPKKPEAKAEETPAPMLPEAEAAAPAEAAPELVK